MAHPPEGRGRRCILKVAKPFWRAPSFALSYPSGLSQAAQTFKPNRIKSRGSGVLDPQTSASGFSCRGSEPLSKRHGNSGYHCCAGCFNRVAKHWNLGESQGFGGRHRRGEKGGYKVFQMRKAKATPLQLHGWRRRYRRLPPEEIQVFPPWRFSRGLREQSSCKRSGKRPRNGAEELREPPPSRPGTGPSTAEKRLGALRKNRGEHRVSFADGPGPLSTRRAAEDPRGAKDGTGGRHRSSASQEANQLAIVKKEVEVIPSESEKEDKKKKKKASKLSNTLARAAQLRNAVDQRKPRKKSSSISRSRRRKRKRKGALARTATVSRAVELPRATNPWWPRSSGEA